MKKVDTTQINYSVPLDNVFTLVCKSNSEKFKIANTNVNAKTIVITNTLNGEITIRLDYRIAATFTYPTTVTWKDGVTPSFTVGKMYFLFLSTDDNGSTYQGIWTGSW